MRVHLIIQYVPPSFVINAHFVGFLFSIHKLIYFFFSFAKRNDNMTRQKSSRRDSRKTFWYFYFSSLV